MTWRSTCVLEVSDYHFQKDFCAQYISTIHGQFTLNKMVSAMVGLVALQPRVGVEQNGPYPKPTQLHRTALHPHCMVCITLSLPMVLKSQTSVRIAQHHIQLRIASHALYLELPSPHLPFILCLHCSPATNAHNSKWYGFGRKCQTPTANH